MKKIQKPDPNRMWETFVKLSLEDVPTGKHINVIRKRISPLLSRLEKEGVINWYCFLIHDKNTGVPISLDDNNMYFHIRFSLVKDVDPNDLLPSYCVLTRKTQAAWVEAITGLTNRY